MNIIPTGVVELYKNISLDPSYTKTFFFKNAVEQDTYFTTTIATQKVLTNNHVTYQREKRNTIRLQLDDRVHIDDNGYVNIKDVYNCNYMRFRNTDVTTTPFINKWYYAFILDIEYVNNTTIEVTYEIDLMQTWLPKHTEVVDNQTVVYENDYELGSCFVVRNHPDHDVTGDNLQPENFEMGESIPTGDYFTPEIAKSYTDPNDPTTVYYNDEWSVVIVLENYFLTQFIDELTAALRNDPNYLGAYGSLYSGVYQGLAFLALPCNYDYIDDIGKFIVANDLGSLGGVVTVFMCPTFCLPVTKVCWQLGETPDDYYARVKAAYNQNKVNNTSDIMVKNLNTELNYITSPTTFDGYVPINNKLFTYPYNYLYASNNRGQNAIYRYEFFTDKHATFRTEGNFGVQVSIMCYPMNYKHQTRMIEEKIMIENFPTCSFQSSNLVDWLAKAAMISISGGETAGAEGGADFYTMGNYTRQSKYKNENKSSKMSLGSGVGSEYKNQGRNRDSGDRWSYRYNDQGNKIPISDGHNTRYEEHENSGWSVELPNPFLANRYVVGNSDILLGNKYTQTFTVLQMQIYKENAKKIDNYLSRYGYAINNVEKPKINNRPKFTYIETNGCCMTTNNIPASVEDAICKIYDKGITFWNDKTQVDRFSYQLYYDNKPTGSGGGQA